MVLSDSNFLRMDEVDLFSSAEVLAHAECESTLVLQSLTRFGVTFCGVVPQGHVLSEVSFAVVNISDGGHCCSRYAVDMIEASRFSSEPSSGVLINAVAECESTAASTLCEVATLIGTFNLYEADSASSHEIVWKSVNSLSIGVVFQVCSGERFAEVFSICLVAITSLVHSGVVVLTERSHDIVTDEAERVGVSERWDTVGLGVPETKVLVVTLSSLSLCEKLNAVNSSVGFSVVGGVVVVHDEGAIHILNVQVENDGMNELAWAVVGH